MSDPISTDSETFHRLNARLATLDLDPATLEMLIAVLNVDLEPRDRASTTATGSA